MSELSGMLTSRGRGVHALSVARSEAQRQSMLTRWVSEGLAQGARFVYAEPDTTPRTRSVSTVLADGGVDIDQAKNDGCVVKLPMTHFYAAGGPARIVAAANAEGFDIVRIAAEARHALKVLDQQAYLAYEWELVHVCGSSALSALCQLDAAETREWFTEVSPMHLGDGAESPFLAVPGDGDVMLFGEVDVTNSDRLAVALGRAGDLAGGVLRVDMDGLSFLSAAGCRALLEGTSTFRGRGGEVLLLATRPPVERVLRLVGLDRARGFALGREPR